MLINHPAPEYPNFDFGYETTINMPFHFSRLSQGQLISYDEGPEYDRYSVKGSMTIPPSLLPYMGEFGSPVYRGHRQVLHYTVTKGFYPFTPAIAGVSVKLGATINDMTDTFYVAFNKVDIKGKADIFARAFRADMEMFMLTEEGNTPLFADEDDSLPEGALVIGTRDLTATIEGVRYPVNGFNPSVEYNAYPRQMPGGGFTSVNYKFLQTNEPRTSAMIITANTNTAAKIIKALVADIRNNQFRIKAPSNYAVFGAADYKDFAVTLSSGDIRVKHTRFDEFEITLNVKLEYNHG
jgi:hypothetical protein